VLAILLGASIVYGGICLLFVCINVVRLPRLPPAPPPQEHPRFVSLIVPARDEERDIETALASLLAQDYPPGAFEVIVVDDRSTDGTAAILARLAVDPALRVIPGGEPPPGWLGKPHALHQGARAARGELLLFVDAVVIYAADTVSRAVAFLDAKRADFLALLPRAEARGFWENVLLPNLECAIYFGPAFLVTARWPRRIAAGGGAGNLVRKPAYDAVGGHEAIRASVVDDVRLAVEVKSAGHPTLFAVADDLVSVRIYRGFREVWDGFTKNTAYVLNGATGVLLAIWLVAWAVVSILPPVVILASWAGLPVPPVDVWRAVVAWGVMVAARAALALALRKPLWAALTQPLMAAVWAGLLVRSSYRRFVRRSLTWRGREFPAKDARF